MISIIVAASDNDVIGRENDLPWRLSRDLKNFSKLTTGNTALMGRRTFESIVARLGHPLPNRKNVVMTRQSHFVAPPECVVVSSWEEAMEKMQDEDVFVCGGAEIYKLALSRATHLYLTRVHVQSDGDVKLPPIDFSEWNLIHEEQWLKDEKNEHDATYQIYERRK